MLPNFVAKIEGKDPIVNHLHTLIPLHFNSSWKFWNIIKYFSCFTYDSWKWIKKKKRNSTDMLLQLWTINNTEPRMNSTTGATKKVRIEIEGWGGKSIKHWESHLKQKKSLTVSWKNIFRQCSYSGWNFASSISKRVSAHIKIWCRWLVSYLSFWLIPCN